MWALERWYWRTYLQGRSEDADVERRSVATEWGKGGWDALGDWD